MLNSQGSEYRKTRAAKHTCKLQKRWDQLFVSINRCRIVRVHSEFEPLCSHSKECVISKNSGKGKSSPPEVLLWKDVLKICRKFREEHPCRSATSIKLLCNAKQIYWNHTSAWCSWKQMYVTLRYFYWVLFQVYFKLRFNYSVII